MCARCLPSSSLHPHATQPWAVTFVATFPFFPAAFTDNALPTCVGSSAVTDGPRCNTENAVHTAYITWSLRSSLLSRYLAADIGEVTRYTKEPIYIQTNPAGFTVEGLHHQVVLRTWLETIHTAITVSW